MLYIFIWLENTAKQGYLEYQWKNPDEETERPKALNMVFNLVTQKLKGNLEFSSENGVKFVITLPEQVML